MTRERDFQRHLPGYLLLFCLVIAVGAFLIWPPERQARTLFFPGTTESVLSGERRLVPRTTNRTKQLRLVVQELILGPSEIRHGRLVPRNSDIRSVAIVNETAYVDLSPEVMFGEEEVRLGVEDGLDGISQTLLYNFRWLEEVVLTIGGQEPSAPSFRIPEEG